MNSIICPFCQRKNNCTVNSDHCWCQGKKIPASLILLLPEHAKNKDCICAACIERYHHNTSAFKEWLDGKTQ